MVMIGGVYIMKGMARGGRRLKIYVVKMGVYAVRVKTHWSKLTS